jgi:cytochrome c peroxidase
MTRKHICIFATLFFSAAFLLVSCNEDGPAITEDIPEINEPDPESNKTDEEVIALYLNIELNNIHDYKTVNYPPHYGPNVLNNDNTPAYNPVTDEGAALGRVLFYDKQLSVNNRTSCASCHSQITGFTDTEQFSLGFEEGRTGAHSMRLVNANFYAAEEMFWDRRAADLEEQTTMPIQDAVEMGFSEVHGGMPALIEKMGTLEYYPVLFEKAFGTSKITEQRMQFALAQFVRSIQSVNSKFDDGYAAVFTPAQPGAGINQPFPNFTAQENLGKNLFLLPPNQGGAGCAGCHQPPAFALAVNSQSNGLDAGESEVFKSPSLKNVGITGPYMHDGRFETLEAVIEHYNSGVQPGPALDNRLRTPQGQPLRLNLSEQEKQALAAFLQTLDDEVILADERFADPFK